MNKADAVVDGVGRALKRKQRTMQDKRRIVEETGAWLIGGSGNSGQ